MSAVSGYLSNLWNQPWTQMDDQGGWGLTFNGWLIVTLLSYLLIRLIPTHIFFFEWAPFKREKPKPMLASL